MIKPTKVAALSKDISLEVFEKQILAWSSINADIPEYSRSQDMIERLKIRKDIYDIPLFVNGHVLKVLDKKKNQTVIKILQ